MPRAAKRFVIVALLSSAARTPRPRATIACATVARSVALISWKSSGSGACADQTLAGRRLSDQGELVVTCADEVGEEEAGGRRKVLVGPGDDVPGPLAGRVPARPARIPDGPGVMPVASGGIHADQMHQLLHYLG